MMDIVFILLAITVLFALLIGLRSLFNLKICALCGAVSATWIALLVMFYVGVFNNPIILGILMGGSVVGAMYLLEQKLPERFQIFKLPFFLTFVSVAYFVLLQSFAFEVAIIPALLWVCMGAIYAGRNIDALKTLGRKIIECCKNW
jgi:hypothetical protein